MADDFSRFLACRTPNAERPLLGLTILVVEDSRFASEAIRLLGMRTGARIRRADCLRSARRHLQTYRPGVVIVDLGLPDGSGLDLIRDLAATPGREAAILATSGSADAGASAFAAGADGFLPKPVENLAAFARAVQSVLPDNRRTESGRADTDDDPVTPDPLALRDDLHLAVRLIGDRPDDGALDYVAQFLSGVAQGAHDPVLEQAATDLALARRQGAGTGAGLARLCGLVEDRLRAAAPF